MNSESPHVLILSSRFDLTSDYVVSQLRSIGTQYFRLNTEDLSAFRLALDPIGRVLSGRSDVASISVTAEDLRSVYFRQPVFLRESALAGQSIREQIVRTQWAAFIRSLLVFDQAQWINPLGATYVAEHKAVQLAAAAGVGFDVPRTSLTNTADDFPRICGTGKRVAVKGIDTVIARDSTTEVFGYTLLVDEATLRGHDVRSMPFALQEGLEGKLDLRVTVVDDESWCAAITSGGRRIEGDWRLRKQDVEYRLYDLPAEVAARCVALTRRLGLTFGAIDLALVGERYVFLEINPTGEWAWLADALGLPIAGALATRLTEGRSHA